ncbi:MAG: DUF3131 domain-containing protein, partial [Acetobacteraceae bacterium]|nr:DUF3131 domain-containing protein [Acetobacteraceae bacterium]
MTRRARALCCAACLLWLAGCGVVARKVYDAVGGTTTPSERHARWAKAAWAYFDKNRGGATGLASTVAGGWFTTPSTVADQLAALISARRLGIIAPEAFDLQLSQVLQFLNTMPLSQGGMPAKVYSIETGQPVNFSKQPADLGWSATDAGRLLTWLRITANLYPAYALYAANAVARWNVCSVLDGEGRLQGANATASGPAFYRDTATGYQAYAVQGYRAWGMQVPAGRRPSQDFTIEIYRSSFPLSAGPEGAPPVLTAPYALLGIEYGWRAPDGSAVPTEYRTAEAVHDVQEARYDATRILTARTDYRRSAEPYEVIDAILANGFPWSTTDVAGKARPDLALVSTRAVFGLWALWTTAYTSRLLDRSDALFEDGAGWFEGRYEKTG